MGAKPTEGRGTGGGRVARFRSRWSGKGGGAWRYFSKDLKCRRSEPSKRPEARGAEVHSLGKGPEAGARSGALGAKIRTLALAGREAAAMGGLSRGGSPCGLGLHGGPLLPGNVAEMLVAGFPAGCPHAPCSSELRLPHPAS